MQLEQFIREHGEELLRLAYTYVKSREAAEDVVQDVLLKAYEQREQFRGGSTYRTYLYRMTINRSYDYLRSWSYKNTVLTNKIQQIFQGTKSAEQQVLTQSDNRLLGQAVLDLPVKYREIIILYYYKELKIDEIANLLSCSDNTVKTRLKRGREKLKDNLEGGAWDDEFSSEASN
ncbi:RNA polymerase subunit sigma-24 [Lysinibacillus sp. 2017]|uniref:sigma-70 family RNA polymerase sigma factor n=1 Tax=unclassified Lysinibacillus TaxID=2636778 RepID=UPI000D52736C|nr:MULTISPECIES: sigma-70 family RNA polymerase sigma factor [unclassified Lysinibacillus]AWE08478.1 RNA polymerase subunit sigma-24 [Lysinibacillus sp. 2017]TGN34966.1 sigma-70 family RNA polymerase sigma factor [Lysinibacillus sp. S2017]